MQRTSTKTSLGLTTLWMLLTASIQAEVVGAGAPLPGLESDAPDTVVPRACSVRVDKETVTVRLWVKTDAEMPALLLNSPLFGATGKAEPYPDRHFPELEIYLEDRPVTPNDRFEAWMGKTNITNLIRAAEMDPWAIVRTPPTTGAHPANPQVLNALKNVGAIEQAGDEYLAKWKVRRLLRIPINAVPEQRVQLRYSARPARSTVNFDQVITPSIENAYCLSPAQLRGTLHGGRGAQFFAVTEYAISTSVDDHAPSAVTFTLSAGGDAATPRAAIFLCGPHRKSIAKTGSVTRQPVQVDEHGTLRVLTVAESPAKSR